MCIHLIFNYQKATQAINFFACRSGGKINKMKAIKLIYFADRYHLRKYGRPITNDEYFAMSYGPVNSGVKDIAELSQFLGEQEREYASKYLQSNGQYDVVTLKPVDEDVFSETDIEAMTFAWAMFGIFDQYKLAELSHNYPEWKRFEQVLRSSSRLRMNYEDFLEDPGDGFEKCCSLTNEEKADRIEMMKEAEKINNLWD